MNKDLGTSALAASCGDAAQAGYGKTRLGDRKIDVAESQEQALCTLTIAED